MKRIGVYSSILGTLSSTVLFSNYIDYTVKSGDTLFGIAFSYDMTANEFLKVNNIKDPDSYKLKVGEKLKVKDKEYKLFFDSKTKTFSLNEASQKSYKNYTVKNGDTLLDIAYKHGMSATEFSDINNIKDFKTYNLKVGEVLKVANVDEKSNNTSNTSTVKPNTAKPNSNDDFERVPYKVKSGDTLYGIAFANGMTANEFLAFNGIESSKDYKLYVGQTLYIKKKKDSSNDASSSSNKTDSIKRDTVNYIVQTGDTLYGIAFENNMSVNDFLKINNIEDPLKYNLRVGETLKVYANTSKPNNSVVNQNNTGKSQKVSKNIVDYKVKSGDTLLGIAFANSMTLSEVLKLNAITEKHNLKVGENIKVYQKVDIKLNSGSSDIVSANANSKRDYIKLKDYKVKSGDTLSEIAEDFGMDLVDLYSINNITDKYVLKVGDVLKVYDEDEIKTIVVESNYKVKSGDTLYSIARNHSMSINELLEVNKIKDINSYKLLVGNTIKVTTIKKQSKRETRSLPDASFSWPYRGSIVSKYGVDSEKLSNRGIRISAKVGDNVLAADEGIVEYADNIRGFGFVVILKHRNGYNTSYANLSKLNVKLGDIVKKGESLGAIGSSPLTKKDELYFKVSYLGYPVDPVKLLPEG